MKEVLDLSRLQAVQAEYDNTFWSHEAGQPTVEHVFAQTAKLLGKLAIYVEAKQNGVQPSTYVLTGEVIPDLVLLGTRLANLMKEDGTPEDLSVLVANRIDWLTDKFSDSPTTAR
jgi:hypothetical protein